VKAHFKKWGSDPISAQVVVFFYGKCVYNARFLEAGPARVARGRKQQWVEAGLARGQWPGPARFLVLDKGF
jgi:hypothetical protein